MFTGVVTGREAVVFEIVGSGDTVGVFGQGLPLHPLLTLGSGLLRLSDLALALEDSGPALSRHNYLPSFYPEGCLPWGKIRPLRPALARRRACGERRAVSIRGVAQRNRPRAPGHAFDGWLVIEMGGSL